MSIFTESRTFLAGAGANHIDIVCLRHGLGGNVTRPRRPGEPQFPECLDWLRQHQHLTGVGARPGRTTTTA